MTSIKLKIVNNSGYADNQIYLIVWGYTWADPTTAEGHTPHHLDLKTGNYPACLTDDNTVSVTGSPDKYCNYWVTLDQIKQPDGSYSFSFPEINSARLVISFQRPAYFHINPAKPPQIL